MSISSRRLIPGLCLAFVALSPMLAQMTVTGSISGTVKDPSGEMVAGAVVTITSEQTGEVRSTKSSESGTFNFAAVQPDTYSLKVEHAGFKTVRRTGMVLSANERFSLGDVRLEIGAVTETVNVVAEGASVQTTSSEHSAVITGSEIANIQARGRDITSLFKMLPGVQATADSDSVGGSYGSGTPNVGGMSNNTNILAVDGVVSNDMGTP